jgi:CheY-like chemotaxis protein
MANILVVEDHPDSLAALGALPVKSGHHPTCVRDGREALMSILAKTPDLVILDLVIPEIDGTGLLEIMRTYLRLQSLPVIVFTGLPDGAAAERARRLGVNTLLVKGSATLDEVAKAVEQELYRAPL